MFAYGLLQEQEKARRDHRAQAAQLFALKSAYQDYETILMLHLADPSRVSVADARGQFTQMERALQTAEQTARAPADVASLATVRAGFSKIDPMLFTREAARGTVAMRGVLLALTGIQTGLMDLETASATRDEAFEGGLAMHRVAQVLMGLSAVALLLLIGRLLATQSSVMQSLRTERDSIDAKSAAQLAAIEASPDGIVILDRDGRITFMNRAFALLHYLSGPGRKESINKPWADLYDDAGSAMVREMILPAARAKGFWRGQGDLKNRRGKPLTAELSLTVLDPDGAHGGGFIATALDTSEKQAREKETEALRLQYYQAQKMESLGRLAGGIAHDFNNILAAITGYAEFLSEDLPKGSQTHGFAEKILVGTLRAKGLIEQILNFSRTNDRGRADMDLNRAVAEVVSMLRASLSSGVAIETRDAAAARISANPTQVSQALMNLCVNAQDAMEGRGVLGVSVDVTTAEALGVPAHMVGDQYPEGSVAAPVHIESVSDARTVMLVGHIVGAQAYARVSVSDTGTGISREVAAHMFEPFFTTKDIHKGTGLGLASVHGILISHRGFLRVDTTMEGGSSFQMLFPLKEGAADEASGEEEDEDASPQAARVLVVDDEDEVRTTTCLMLQRAGYEVYDAPGANDALDMIRDNPLFFDVVVSDYAMPAMTGGELAQAAMDFAPGLPFIMVSGYAEDQMRERISAVPSIRAVLKKPVSTADLLQGVRAALSALQG